MTVHIGTPQLDGKYTVSEIGGFIGIPNEVRLFMWRKDGTPLVSARFYPDGGPYYFEIWDEYYDWTSGGTISDEFRDAACALIGKTQDDITDEMKASQIMNALLR